jgi:hypothetical protein
MLSLSSFRTSEYTFAHTQFRRFFRHEHVFISYRMLRSLFPLLVLVYLNSGLLASVCREANRPI